VEVQDFGQSTADDPHYVCDGASGEIRFGPILRGPDGSDVQYGRIPRSGAQVRFSRYRVGGGTKGNVGRNTLTVLKSSIPYVAAVSNRYSAQGGVDAETLDQAKLRAPSVLRSSDVAITAADYERCALASSEQVARAYTLAAGMPGGKAGTVTLLIVPHVHMDGGPVGDEELAITRRLEEDVRNYLEPRRPLTVELAISAPEYQRVGIEVAVRARRGEATQDVEAAVKEAFYHFLHPTVGGPDRTGWPLGRPLFAAELLARLHAVESVDFVTQLQIRVFDPESGGYGAPVESTAPSELGMLIAGACAVEVTA
jgi:predicted phage baseplate assembly protein